MRKLCLALGFLLAGCIGAFAQTTPVLLPGGCATGSFPNAIPYLTINSTGQLCTAASVSASITGFRPAAFGTPISVTTGGVTGTLPGGAEVVATNVGTTNGAYCALGASASTASQYIAPNGGWFGFAISGDTQLTCITGTSTTTVNLSGGSGLPTGTGGGGGGSGASGAITAASGSYAAGALSAGAGVDGWDLTQGAKADAAWTSGSGSLIAIAKAIDRDVNGSIPAGTNTIGATIPTPTSNSANALSHASTTAATGTSLVAKASAGNLYGYNCTAVAGAAAGYCIVYNGTTAPSTGALTGANVLDFCEFDTTARGCSLSRIPMAVNYSTGIVLLVTSATTPYTYTTGTLTAAMTADFQ